MISLKKNEDFRQCYKKGKSYANHFLVIYVLENDTGMNRIGISTSKKVGNSVVRHRIARLVRESYRLHESRIRGSWIFAGNPDGQDIHYDIAVVGRRSAGSASYHEIETALLHLLQRAGIYKA